jgi:hypothetical protein
MDSGYKSTGLRTSYTIPATLKLLLVNSELLFLSCISLSSGTRDSGYVQVIGPVPFMFFAQFLVVLDSCRLVARNNPEFEPEILGTC